MAEKVGKFNSIRCCNGDGRKAIQKPVSWHHFKAPLYRAETPIVMPALFTLARAIRHRPTAPAGPT